MTRRRSTFDSFVWGVHHDAFTDPLGKILTDLWQRNVHDDLVVKLIEEKVAPLQAQDALGELNPFRKPRLGVGEICPGDDVDGDRIFIPHASLPSGTLILGNTGSGKSTLIMALVLQVAMLRCRVWISEMYKTAMRHLRRPLQRIGVDLVVLRPPDWRFNLFQAGGCDPRIHLAMVVDLLARDLDLQSRGRGIVQRAGHALYRKFNNWLGQDKEWPCLIDVFEWIRTAQGLNPAAREAVLDRLVTLIMAMTPRCAAYRGGWTASDLAQHSIVFEMRGMAEHDKSIRLHALLFSILHNEVQRGAVNAPLSLWCCFEDAQRFFSDRPSGVGLTITPMEELAGVCRGMGIGLCLSAQSGHHLSSSIVANMATKIIGRLGSHEDQRRLGADAGMNHAQIDWARRHLKPGMFVLQCADGDWREPALIQAHALRLPAVVDDAEAAESVKALDYLPTRFAEEYANWRPDEVLDVSPRATQKAPVALSDVEFRFLESIIENPGQPSSRHARDAGISGRRAAELRRRFVAEGLLREHKVATAPRGRQSIVLEPLEPALRLVEQHRKVV